MKDIRDQMEAYQELMQVNIQTLLWIFYKILCFFRLKLLSTWRLLFTNSFWKLKKIDLELHQKMDSVIVDMHDNIDDNDDDV